MIDSTGGRRIRSNGTLARRLARWATWAAAGALVLLWSLPGTTRAASPAAEQGPVVRAVLFYAPTCPHCHQVMTYDLPPLLGTYGSRLQIATVDVTTEAGSNLYNAAATQYKLAAGRLGVPSLFVGSVNLVGSEEIPDQFPQLVSDLMAQGGCDWPPIVGLADYFSSLGTIPLMSPPASSAGESEGWSPAEALDRAARDPAGSTLAVVVLAALLLCLAWAASVAWRADWRLDRLALGAPSNLIPLVALIELAVAAYMASVEIGGSAAICGPVGDCNRVHQSEYAWLFGLISVGLFGVAGSATVLATWVVGRLAGGTLAQLGRMGLLAAAAFGVAFSAYLTFLEPFVIGATCGWCLASAVLMAAILVLATASMWPQPAVRAPMPRRRRSRRARAG